MSIFDLHSRNYVILSLLGPHAGESEEKILRRKTDDVSKAGRTFWLYHSSRARPDVVQSICAKAQEKHESVYCAFIEPAQQRRGQSTKTGSAAKFYSRDNNVWHELPNEISPVTGLLNSGAFALVFDCLEHGQVPSEAIDLWDYADFTDQEKPIKIHQGGSTLCAIRKDMSRHPEKIKSQTRKVVAVGALVKPFCVWLKK